MAAEAVSSTSLAFEILGWWGKAYFLAGTSALRTDALQYSQASTVL
jgi:hypothetical protein